MISPISCLELSHMACRIIASQLFFKVFLFTRPKLLISISYGLLSHDIHVVILCYLSFLVKYLLFFRIIVIFIIAFNTISHHLFHFCIFCIISL